MLTSFILFYFFRAKENYGTILDIYKSFFFPSPYQDLLWDKIELKTLAQSILSLADPSKVPSFISGSPLRCLKYSHNHNLSYCVVSTIFPASVPCGDVSCQGCWCWQMLLKILGSQVLMKALSPLVMKVLAPALLHLQVLLCVFIACKGFPTIAAYRFCWLLFWIPWLNWSGFSVVLF